jgi:signal transduction histidine kinase
MMGANMDTNYDPFRKHRKLIKYLMLGHMSTFSVNTHLTSMLGYSEILLKGAVGPLNEDQKHFLSIINNNTHHLHKHLNTFITATRLIFNPQQIYISKFSPSESVDRFIERITKGTEFQIDKDISENLHEIEGDASLIDYAIDNIEGIVTQIHPDGKGNVKIIIREDEKLLKFIVSTNKDRIVDLGEENMELFVVQSVIELHGGSFEINYDDDRCDMTFTLPVKQERD